MRPNLRRQVDLLLFWKKRDFYQYALEGMMERGQKKMTCMMSSRNEKHTEYFDAWLHLIAEKDAS